MGVVYSFIIQTYPPKPRFTVDDIPDLTGKVVLVTGANTGIGKETTKALLAHNAKVYIATRNEEQSNAVIEELKTETGNKAIFLRLDLSVLKSVKAAAQEFLSKEKELHILFNNGGVMGPPIESITSDGYDMQFGTNVLGHYYFTTLLLPALLAGANSSPDKKVRVVNTSSIGHEYGDLDFNTFKDSPSRRKKTTEWLYFQSKFGNIVFSNELARRYGDQGIVSTALNPGNAKTGLQRNLKGLTKTIIESLLYPASYGALTQLYAGTSKEGANLNGKYLIPWARVHAPKAKTQDPKLGKELWAWLEEQVKDV